MGFFRDRDCSFLARSKKSENTEMLGIGIGIWKSRKNYEWKIAEIRKSLFMFKIWSKIFELFKRNLEYLQKIKENFFFLVFTIIGQSGFFHDFLKIPKIFESREFYLLVFNPWDSGFFRVSKFKFLGFGILSSGYPDNFVSWDRDFFRGIGKPPLVI